MKITRRSLFAAVAAPVVLAAGPIQREPINIEVDVITTGWKRQRRDNACSKAGTLWAIKRTTNWYTVTWSDGSKERIDASDPQQYKRLVKISTRLAQGHQYAKA
jgi:hypothetical protein